MTTGTRPAVEGWFDTDPPRLTGLRCAACDTVVFPPTRRVCPNPACTGDDLAPAALSTSGTVWSYATNHYAPPPPYVATTEPFEPVTVVAVELAEDGLVVLGQLDGDVDDVRVGTAVELSTSELFTDDDGDTHTVWSWRVS